MDKCKRCGTCCRKGGPALHVQDLELVSKGVLNRVDLVTLRRGEMAFDPILDEVIPLPGEVIKIKSKALSPGCRFLEPNGQGCMIYDIRPLECRSLYCWNTEGLEAIYDKDRLTRADLFPKQSGLGDIIAEHEAKCPITDVVRLAGEAVKTKGKPHMEAIQALVALAEYDRSLRAVLVQKAGASLDELDVILGRAVLDILPAMGMRLERKDGKTYKVIRTKSAEWSPGRALWRA